MSIQSKLAAFDHVVFRLTEWYSEKNGQWVENDLSRLKVIKLLFFVTATTTKLNTPGLLSTFDRFAALPYGHVESEILDRMEGSLSYDVTRKNLSFKDGIVTYNRDRNQLDDTTADMIDQAIVELRLQNDNLINYSAFDLVDLSHRWQSWKTVFSLAKSSGKFSMAIPNEMIMTEPKIFK